MALLADGWHGYSFHCYTLSKAPEYYKQLLDDIHHLSHITIEAHECKSEPCISVGKK